MKTLTVVAFLLLIAASCAMKLGGFGACVEMCSMGKTNACPDGQVCASNGCGHTCQPDRVSSAMKLGGFGICVEMCSMGKTNGCPDGQVCASNGCGHTCQPDPNCSRLTCLRYCEKGFKNGKDGCPICVCNDNTLG